MCVNGGDGWSCFSEQMAVVCPRASRNLKAQVFGVVEDGAWPVLYLFYLFVTLGTFLDGEISGIVVTREAGGGSSNWPFL